MGAPGSVQPCRHMSHLGQSKQQQEKAICTLLSGRKICLVVNGQNMGTLRLKEEQKTELFVIDFDQI